ncbi:MAG: DUF1015 domain-containing protein [Chromatiales bacterium]|nr:DUF1015 domain-containing protein [Chromatiales bacterium]
MSLIRPIAGLRPAPGRAQDVVAPPYDVLNRAEATQRARGRPHSFLHVSKAEIDLPDSVDAHDPAVYAKAAANLAAMVDAGVLVRDPAPYYYVYRLVMDGRAQTGIVAGASVRAYEAERIRKHEFTRPAKEDDRVRQIEALNAQTGPVFLVHRTNADVDAVTAVVLETAPDVDVVADDGVRHSLWVIHDLAVIDRLTHAFERMAALYVADGHHRSAAATRVAQARRSGHDAPDASHEYFLAVVFPHDQLRILDYNRVVRDLNGLDDAGFLAALTERVGVAQEPGPVAPRASGEFGLYLAGRWYRLTMDAAALADDDPVRRLDVSLLHDRIIAPVLGIHDPRRDERIDFVGGIRGLRELERRVDSGEMRAAFSLYPTQLEALMDVADSGQVMPPKSTWFEPKLADGLVSHVLD